MVDESVIESAIKYRDGKKWKQRWAVLTKLSPVADVLQLQLYRDSRDRIKSAPTKASLALQNILAVETGFTLDKESHTLAILCHEVSVVLAFDNRERLLQWRVKIARTLGDSQQFLVQMLSVPPRSRIPTGPARLHLLDRRFCLTACMPPRLLAAWLISDLRRYGEVDGRFVWEGGSRCGRFSGIHVAVSDQPFAITRCMELAAGGNLGKSHRHAGKCSSGRHTASGRYRTSDLISPDGQLGQQRSFIRGMYDNFECDVGEGMYSIGGSQHLWQSGIETPSDNVSLAPSDAATVTSPRDTWAPDTFTSGAPQLGRCASCTSHIGSPRRRATTISSAYGTCMGACGDPMTLAWGEAAQCHSQNLHTPNPVDVQLVRSCHSDTLATTSWLPKTDRNSLSSQGSSSNSEYSVPRSLAATLYDTPRRLAPAIQPKQQTQDEKQQADNPHVCSSQDKRQQPTNPMDNYDTPSCYLIASPRPVLGPPQGADHYDTPRRLIVPEDVSPDVHLQQTSQDNPPSSEGLRDDYAHTSLGISSVATMDGTGAVETHTLGPLVTAAQGCACARVMTWAETLIPCRKGAGADVSAVEHLRVNGEGRMPVMDANTGTLRAVPAFLPVSSPTCGGSTTTNTATCASTPASTNEVTPQQSPALASTKGDSTIKKRKPRAPTPPPSPPERREISQRQPPPGATCLSKDANYANLQFAQSLQYYENSRELLQRVNNLEINLRPCGSSSTSTTSSSVTCPMHQGQVEVKGTCDVHMVADSLAVVAQQTAGGAAGGSQESSSYSTDTASSQASKEGDYLPMGPRKVDRTPGFDDSADNETSGKTSSQDSETRGEYLHMGPSVSGLVPCSPEPYEEEEGQQRVGRSTLLRRVMKEPRPGRSLSVSDVKREDEDYSGPPYRRSSSADSQTRVSWSTSPAVTPVATPTHRPSRRGSANTRTGTTIATVRSGPSTGTTPQKSVVAGSSAGGSTGKSSCSNVITSAQDLVLRRSSSVPMKTANRDSASSSDSGVCESPRPLDQLLTSYCLHASLPRSRRPHMHGRTHHHHCLAPKDSADLVTASCGELATACVVNAGDAKSTSSGTSDMSDYLDTLSLSSYSSSDHDKSINRLNMQRPRSGKEYTKVDRSILSPDHKVLTVLGEADQ